MSTDCKENKIFNEYIQDMDQQMLLDLFIKLAEKVYEENEDRGFRGGIRPGNITIDENDEIIIGEGGIPEKNKWSAEQLEFISPEEFWNGESSVKSDVYGLGLVMYYCLSGGEIPFKKNKQTLTPEDRAKTVRRRMGGEKILAPEGTDEALSRVVEISLAFNPDDRYKAVRYLIAALKMLKQDNESSLSPDVTVEEQIVLENKNLELKDEVAESVDTNERKIPSEEDNELNNIEQNNAEKTLIENTSYITEKTDDIAAERTAVEAASVAAAVATVAEVSNPIDATEKAAVAAVSDKKLSKKQKKAARDDKKKATKDIKSTVLSEQEKTEQRRLENEQKAKAKQAEDSRFVADSSLKSKNNADAKKTNTSATPAVQYATGNNKKTAVENTKRKKSPFAGVLIVCGVIILGAVIWNFFKDGGNFSDIFKNDVAEETESVSVIETTEVPETTETPTETVEPTETPEPAEEPAESQFTFVKANVSWTQAEAACEADGGYLAVIHNQEELNEVIRYATENGIRFIWIGCSRDSTGSLNWVNGDSVSYYAWAQGEPSVTGSSGEAENYVMLWNTSADLTGNWVYNDVGNDPISQYPTVYSGNVGYICEK